MGYKTNTHQTMEQQRNGVIFDRKNLLERLLGDEAIAAEILQEFISDFSEKISRLSGLMQEKNLIASRKLIHTMKGSCSNIGSPAMHQTAAALENALTQENIAEELLIFEQLKNQFQEFQDLVNRES